MKFEPINTPDRRISPLVQEKSSCGCSAPSVRASDAVSPEPPYVTGHIDTKSGRISRVATLLSPGDKWGTLKARMGSFRMSYSVKPGLYAAGNPDENSDVFVSANYKMSFDSLRASLNGLNAWILVLDTNGINVWCAAGKGTFGTSELVSRIKATGLGNIVSHGKLIVPQLGAPGINSGEVKRKSGFRVLYGPVRAADIKEFLNSGYKCTDVMRRVKFTITDRLVLTPIEINQIFAKFYIFALFVFIFFGLTPQGIIFRDSVFKGYIFIAAGLLAVFAGAFFTPVFLPFIPFRSFAVKGWVAGVAIFSSVVYFGGIFKAWNIFLIISAMILFPLMSSYMALQFTGASTYTSLSGVKRELKFAFPVYISGSVLSFLFLILYKLSDWRLI